MSEGLPISTSGGTSRPVMRTLSQLQHVPVHSLSRMRRALCQAKFPTEGVALTHLLVISDLDRSWQFYQDVLGATVYREYGGSSCVLNFQGSWLPSFACSIPLLLVYYSCSKRRMCSVLFQTDRAVPIFTREWVKEQRLWPNSNPFFLKSYCSIRS